MTANTYGCAALRMAIAGSFPRPNHHAGSECFSPSVESPTDLAWDGVNLWMGASDWLGPDIGWRGSILQLDPVTGAILATFDTPGAAAVGLTWRNGLLYVSDRRLIRSSFCECLNLPASCTSCCCGSGDDITLSWSVAPAYDAQCIETQPESGGVMMVTSPWRTKSMVDVYVCRVWRSILSAACLRRISG
jgi:hypothetical protein